MLAPQQGNGASNDQKRTVRNIVAPGTGAREQKQETDQPSCQDRDQQGHKDHRESGDQANKGSELDVTGPHPSWVEQSSEVKESESQQSTDQDLFPVQSGRKGSGDQRQQDRRENNPVEHQAMLQVNDGDENENRHVDAEQEHVGCQTIAGVEIAQDDCRDQLYQHSPQRQGCTTVDATSPPQ
jgi:hypothetical protein